MQNLSSSEFMLLLAVALWTLPWKGVALWKAVKRNDQKWFIALLVLNTIGILEILYIYIFSTQDFQGHLNRFKAKIGFGKIKE